MKEVTREALVEFVTATTDAVAGLTEGLKQLEERLSPVEAALHRTADKVTLLLLERDAPVDLYSPGTEPVKCGSCGGPIEPCLTGDGCVGEKNGARTNDLVRRSDWEAFKQRTDRRLGILRGEGMGHSARVAQLEAALAKIEAALAQQKEERDIASWAECGACGGPLDAKCDHCCAKCLAGASCPACSPSTATELSAEDVEAISQKILGVPSSTIPPERGFEHRIQALEAQVKSIAELIPGGVSPADRERSLAQFEAELAALRERRARQPMMSERRARARSQADQEALQSGVGPQNETVPGPQLAGGNGGPGSERQSSARPSSREAE